MKPALDGMAKFAVGSTLVAGLTMMPPAKPLLAAACIAAYAVATLVPEFADFARGTGRSRPLRLLYAVILSALTNYITAWGTYFSGVPLAHSLHIAQALAGGMLVFTLTVLLDRVPPTVKRRDPKKAPFLKMLSLVDKVKVVHGERASVRA